MILHLKLLIVGSLSFLIACSGLTEREKNGEVYIYDSGQCYRKSEPSVKLGRNQCHAIFPDRIKMYYRGSRGGCYYMSGSKKVYVDRSVCN